MMPSTMMNSRTSKGAGVSKRSTRSKALVPAPAPEPVAAPVIAIAVRIARAARIQVVLEACGA